MKSLAILALLIGVLAIEPSGVFSFNYNDALQKSLLFFEAQRSGKLPANQHVKWRGDSGLHDGSLQGVNLVGGYYDAGDHVKFGLPMAFSVSILSWGAIDFRKQITSNNQLGQVLDAIKWGTDYFMKAHTQPNVLWGQVGDGDSDHYCWERAEDMTTSRTAYKIDPAHPGSDLAGETAAALAAASLAFKPYNSAYSDLLLVHAKQLFSFADRFRGKYDDSIPSARKYYASVSGYSDELLWAATWLHRATGEEYYLKYVVDNADSLGGIGISVGEFSWENKYAGVQVLLAKVLMEGHGGPYTATLKQYQAKAEYFMCACLQKNNGYNVPMTPGGLLYVHEWNNMQYVSSASFLLAVYSDYLSASNAAIQCPDAQLKSQDLLVFAQSQADYILGKNPKSMSYLVGYGASYPVHIHHRGASIVSESILHSTVGCVQGFESWYHRQEGNPNVLFGALVGGPNNRDEFIDNRDNYEQTEPTISGTAPLIGLFSRLHSGGSIETYTEGPLKPSVSSLKHLPPPRVPVTFVHSITYTWTAGHTVQYRHKVNVKNISQKPITKLRLSIQNLSGTLWGLTPTAEKTMYELPLWIHALAPRSQFSFVYVQGGPQAKVSVISYA
ncbi:cellulase [Ranunculus cassubicifolius]